MAIGLILHHPLSTHRPSLGWSITMIPLWSRKIIVRTLWGEAPEFVEPADFFRQ